MKKAKVIKKENSKECPWMTHYTLLYRNREYVETLEGEKGRDRYQVGDIIEVSTYKNKSGSLCFMMMQVVE